MDEDRMRRPSPLSPGTSPTAPDDAAGALHALASMAAERHHIPAMAYGVIVDGRLVARGGIGDPGDGAGPPDERTLFRIASMTKSFTAAAVLRLRDAGHLALDDAVARHVPAAGELRPPSARLAADHDPPPPDHVGGARHRRRLGRPASRRRRRRNSSAGSPRARLRRPPGTVFEYSNLGYGILGQMVEAVAADPAAGLREPAFLGPLGMSDTVWDAGAPGRGPGMARPSAWSTVRPSSSRLRSPTARSAPMGGLWSTVADLARWVAFLADAFPPRDGADDGPLRRASRREMQQVARAIPASIPRDDVVGPPASGRPAATAMGLEVVEHLELGTMVTHSGGLPGFGSNMRWLPDRGVGVVAVANRHLPADGASSRATRWSSCTGAVPSRPRRSAGRRARRGGRALGELLSGWNDARAGRSPRRQRRARRSAGSPAGPGRGASPRRHGPLLARIGHGGARHARARRADRRARARAPDRGAGAAPGRTRAGLRGVVGGAGERCADRRSAPAGRSRRVARPGRAGRAARARRRRRRRRGGAAARRRAHPVRPSHRRRDRGRRRATDAQGGEQATLRWHGERGDLDVALRFSAGRLRIERLTPRPLPDP